MSAGEGVRILGIDPGSRATGWAVLDVAGGSTVAVDHGVLRPKADSVPDRLRELAEGVEELCARHDPDEVALEEAFAARNVRSALILGQTRGALMVSVGRDRPVFQYAARAVKKAVAGYGQADKRQVAEMVTRLLQLDDVPAQDAADALALALCHAQSRRWSARLEQAR